MVLKTKGSNKKEKLIIVTILTEPTQTVQEQVQAPELATVKH